MKLAYIALGSNLEPRAERLAKARSLLLAIAEGQWAESSIRETEPIGPAQGKFLNQVVRFKTSRSPRQLLHLCKGIELMLGRKPRGHWENREIDLDILYMNDLRIQEWGLEIPHPQISLRSFVLEPLCELDAQLIDPVNGMTVARMLDALRGEEA